MTARDTLIAADVAARDAYPPAAPAGCRLHRYALKNAPAGTQAYQAQEVSAQPAHRTESHPNLAGPFACPQEGYEAPPASA